MNKEIMVSVSCITYNHENFIVQAIESFLMQETNFEFEIVIGDDCSTDSTKEIILSYVDKFPGKIRFINRLKNIGSAPNFMQTIKECCGKYIALCEGDDYWTDPLKLQKQIDFLESHSEYTLCATRYKYIDEEVDKIAIEMDHLEKIYDESNNYQISKDNIFDPYALKTLTVVFRNNIIDQKLFSNKICGDIFLFSNLLLKGNGIILNFFSGIYRIHEAGIYSMKNEFQKANIEFKRVNSMFTFYKGKYASINILYFWSLTKLVDLLKSKTDKTLKDHIMYANVFLKKKYFNKSIGR